MFSKWGTLIFFRNLHRKSTHCSLHWRLPSSVEGKMNSRFIYHTRCLLRSTKDEKRGKQMAKQINYTKKNHVTCQIYTLFYVAVFFFSCIVEIEFWKPYTLLTPFMLHQFIEVDSFFPFSVSMAQNLINTVFVHGIYALFNLTLERANATWNPTESLQTHTGWWWGESEEKEERAREK